MKTRELIRQLIEADPTGEIEVCVGNIDIHFVEYQPAYYDGALQVLQRDENCKYYNITGGKYYKSGHKINLHTLSFSDAISNHQDFTVDYSELNPDQAKSMQKYHDDLRKWHKNLDNELELEYFTKWAKEKINQLTVDNEDADEIIKDFFDKNISPEDQLKVTLGQSYISARQIQWEDKFEVLMEEGFLKIKTKISP